MRTARTTKKADVTVDELNAKLEEADFRLMVLQALAQTHMATEDMEEISTLATAKERAKQHVAAMRQNAGEKLSSTAHEAETETEQLLAGIARVNEHYSGWDAARRRRFIARLDEAAARLALWKARAARTHSARQTKSNDELATLEEKIALARACAAEARFEDHGTRAQTVLEIAARRFYVAYDAASRRYGRTGRAPSVNETQPSVRRRRSRPAKSP